MTKAEAFKLLRDSSSHVRLKAARTIAKLASRSDLPEIKEHLREEQVSFVQRALEQAVARIERGKKVEEIPDSSEDSDPVDPGSVAYTRAVEFVTNSLLHEISPHLGAIRVEARRAITDYEVSALKLSIDGLAGVLSGIEELQRATVAESLTEINLYDLVQEIAEQESRTKKIPISIQGRRDLIVTADPNLLRIVISNGLRNALEATVQAGWVSPTVVNFGETDVDYWITILDSGPGLSGSSEAAFDVGTTTKSGHRGFGLALARQAMLTLDGSIRLQPGSTGGARLEIRWFR